MKPFVRILSICLGTCLIILLISLIAVRVYLATPHFRNFVLSKINSAISGHIRIDDHRLSLLKGSVAVSHGSLAGPADATLLEFEQLSMNIKWSALLKRKIELSSIVLAKPQVALVRASNGKLTLQQAVSTGSHKKTGHDQADATTARPLAVKIGELRIDSGQLVYTDPEKPLKAVIDDINLVGSLDLETQAAQIKLETGSIHVKSATLDTQVDETRLVAALMGSRLTLSDLQARFKTTQMQISGHVADLFLQPKIDLALKVDGSMADLKTLTGLTPAMTGRIQMQLNTQGPVNNPQASLTLTYGGGHLGIYPLTGATLKIDLADRFLTIQDLSVDAEAGRLSGSGTLDAQKALPGGLLPFQLQSALLAYDFNLRGTQIDVSKIEPDRNTLAGEADGRIHLTGRGIDLRQLSASLAAEITVPKLADKSMTAPVDVALSCASHIDQGNIRVDRLTISSEQLAATLTTTGTVALADRRLNATFDGNLPNLAGILELAGIAGVQGGATLNGDVSGRIAQPHVNLILQGDHLAYGNYRAGSIKCDVRLDREGRLHVSQFELSHQEANIQGQGSVQVFADAWQLDPSMPMALDLSLAALRLEDFWTQAPVKGKFDGHLQLAGSIQKPQGELSLMGRDITTDAGPVGNAELQVRLEDGLCKVEKLDITREKTALRLAGQVQVLDPASSQVLASPEFELYVEGKQIEVSDFTDQASATIDLHAQLKGKVSDPTGTFALRAAKVVFKGQSLDSIELDGAVQDRKISLAPLRIRSQKGDEITAQGWLAFDQSFELAIGSDRWPLAQIELLKDVGEVAGELRFDFAGTGTLNAPVIDGDVQIAGFALNQQPFKDISINFAFRDQRAQLHATQAFDLDAAYALDSGDFTVAAVFDQTQLKPYFAVTGQAGLAGTVTGSVKAHGNTNRLKQATGQVNLASLEVIYGAEKLLSTQNLQAELKDNRFVLTESTWSILEQGRLTLVGKGAFDGSINLSIDGSVPLKSANPFFASVDDLGGQVVVRAMVAGETTHPSIDAQVQLEDIAVTLPIVLQRLHHMNGSIQVVDSKVTFRDVAGQIGKGRFDLSGTLGLAKWQPDNVDLVFNAYQIPVEIPDTMNLVLNSSLSFKGDSENAFAAGEIVLLDGLYFKDVNLIPLRGFTTVKREALPAAPRAASPYFGHTALDVSVKRRRPLVVDNNVAYLEISPDLRLQGTFNNPALSGRAKVETGEIYYTGKTFVVKRGIVDFLNPYKIEPTLDIQSDVEVRNWLITLLVSGTLEDLKVALSSDPPEQKADILSLLVAGKTSAEMRGGSGGSSQSAKQMMAQLVASTFGEDIKGATGIDYLEVTTADDQADGEAGVIKVTIGKKLTERMTVKYAVSSKQGETVRSTISEYQLMDSFLVSGFQDTKGIYGGELVFRIEFR